MKAIKTFRDLLAFLRVIPLGKAGCLVVTSVEAILLFPVIGGFSGAAGRCVVALVFVAGVSLL
jgi:cobalamin synthase